MNKDFLFEKALDYYNNSLYCDAIWLLDEIICQNPEYEECYFYAGRCCENVFFESKAIEYYLKGIEKCSNKEYTSDYHLHIGNCYIKLSKIKDAILHYDEAANFEGNHIVAQLNKARAFVCIKEYEKALAIFEQVKEAEVGDATYIDKYVKYCKTKHQAQK